MPGRAWLILLPLAALSQGCVLVSGDTPAVAQTAPSKSPTSVAQTPRFKEMISAPGQTVAKIDVQPATSPQQVTADLRPPLAQTSAIDPPRLLPDPPVVAAVRAYLDNRPGDAAELLRGLDPANREAVIRLLPLLATAKAGKLTPGGADAANYASLLATAADAAARQAPLRVKKACFVSSVKQFGVYDPLPEGKRFLPGGGEGQLYLELANVASDPTDPSRGGTGYASRAECVLHLTDAAGKTVYRHDPTTSPKMVMCEATHSQVRDYFVSIYFRLPPDPGKYTLAFEYQELSTNRSVRHAIDFAVGP